MSDTPLNSWIVKSLEARIDQLERELAAVTAERDALLKEAERYRWLRANPAMLLHLKNSEFDAAIDAALSRRQA